MQNTFNPSKVGILGVIKLCFLSPQINSLFNFLYNEALKSSTGK